MNRITVVGRPGISFGAIEIQIDSIEVEYLNIDPISRGRAISVVIRMTAPHRDTGKPINLEHRTTYNAEGFTTERCAMVIRNSLRDIYTHEIDEQLFLGGIRVMDPHV